MHTQVLNYTQPVVPTCAVTHTPMLTMPQRTINAPVLGTLSPWRTETPYLFLTTVRKQSANRQFNFHAMLS